MATAGVLHRLAIVADDLTGAADAAAPFAVRGLAVSVALPGIDTPATLAQDAEVLALLTDNRWRSPAEAAGRMRTAVRLVIEGKRVPVVTKSGGFGTRDALRRAAAALEAAQEAKV